MTSLDPKLTFDTFVVGPANRLASAAARRAADSPGASYNPLFLYAASGLGKSHILQAVANQVQKGKPEIRVHYETSEEFLDQLARSLEKADRDAFRDRYREWDLLLLDDIQFLADQPEAQEMMLATIDALSTAGSQIILASDRPPADINGLDARLVSRFSGGLIVDIAAPEFETRVAIIRRKAEDQGQSLEAGVAETLAKVPFKNVRELTGALNRILAIQDLEERQVLAEEVSGIIGTDIPKEAPTGDALGSFLSEVAGAVADQVMVQEEPWRKSIREVAESAEREGFSTKKLRALIQESTAPENWTARLEAFRSGVERLREIDRELDDLNNPWPDAAATLIKDPDRLAEAEAFLNSVRERVRPFAALAPGPKLGDLEGALPPLVLKAAQQLATADRPQYNPLFLWSERADAARAVLAAAGRSYGDHFAQARVAVTSVSGFAEDFIRALSEGVAGAWRERWWTVDLLLVHGAQALSDTERAQDEFFHLFEALKRRGARVLLTADRPPSRIEQIDERLRSRFEGGLVLEVEDAQLPEGSDVLVASDSERDGQDGPGSSWGGLAEQVDAAVVDTGSRPGAATATTAEAKAGPGGTATAVEAARGGGSDPGSASEVYAEVRTRWVPSAEKVVWSWPDLGGRLVEDFE